MSENNRLVNAVTASFNTIMIQATEMSQRKQTMSSVMIKSMYIRMDRHWKCLNRLLTFLQIISGFATKCCVHEIEHSWH